MSPEKPRRGCQKAGFQAREAVLAITFHVNQSARAYSNVYLPQMISYPNVPSPRLDG